MNKLLFFLAFFIVLICCSPKKNTVVLDRAVRTVVTGNVVNSISEEQSIGLAINRVGFEQERIDVPLDSTGNFKIEFWTYVPVDAWISYHVNFLILLNPGDSLQVEFDASQPDCPEVLETIKFSGSSAENNRQAAIFQKSYYESYLYISGHDEPYDRVESAYKNLSADQFRLFVDSISEEGSRFLNDFIRQNNPNQFVKSWAKYFIAEIRFALLTSYPIRHRKANLLKESEWNVPLTYYDYFKECPYEIENGMHASYATNSYLDKHRAFIYATVRDKIKEYPPDKAGQLWDSLVISLIVFETTSASLREILLTYEMSFYLIDKDVETFEKYRPLIEGNIQSEHLWEPLLKKYETARKKIENQKAENYSKVGSLNELMEGIIDKNKGKVIYVDIWATWCAPCREEFPYSKKLQEVFSDDEVSFIYVCIESKRSTYESILQQFQLAGTHYLLDSEQSAELRKGLEIIGVPHYLLIDRNGKLVTTGFQLRPSDDKTEDEIRKLVKDKTVS